MKITVVTSMRNEGVHLLEWIAHHHAAGVTDFLVFTNDCDDGTPELLEAIPSVKHVSLPPGDGAPQWRALKDAQNHDVVVEADWLACIDCDEFINLGNGLGSIVELIETIDADAILMPWRLFGHSGNVEYRPDLTLERFTRAASEQVLYPPIASFFKTLFRRDKFQKIGIHRPKQKNVERHGLPRIVDGSGGALPNGFLEDDGKIMNWGGAIARDLVQLNHYSVRSAAEFIVKRDRGLPNHQGKSIDLTYWTERNFNHVEELTIQHMLPATRAELEALRSDTKVAELEAKAQDWHRAKLDALINTPEGLKLYGRLALASGSAEIPKHLALNLVRKYGEVHG